MRMIILEGIISAGKSTLTKSLCEELNAEPFYEPVQENPYLELYYKDPKKYALAMQFYLMSHRYDMHLKGIEYIWKNQKPVIYDRSIYGDYIFAKKNWLDGNMTDLDFDNYNKMRDVMLRTLMIPHITLFLKVDPEKALDRIKMRGRGCESSIPLSYLKGLSDLYEELMYDLRKRGSNVVKIDWNDFKETSYIIEQIRPFL